MRELSSSSSIPEQPETCMPVFSATDTDWGELRYWEWTVKIPVLLDDPHDFVGIAIRVQISPLHEGSLYPDSQAGLVHWH